MFDHEEAGVGPSGITFANVPCAPAGQLRNPMLYGTAHNLSRADLEVILCVSQCLAVTDKVVYPRLAVLVHSD